MFEPKPCTKTAGSPMPPVSTERRLTSNLLSLSFPDSPPVGVSAPEQLLRRQHVDQYANTCEIATRSIETGDEARRRGLYRPGRQSEASWSPPSLREPRRGRPRRLRPVDGSPNRRPALARGPDDLPPRRYSIAIFCPATKRASLRPMRSDCTECAEGLAKSSHLAGGKDGGKRTGVTCNVVVPAFWI